MQIYRVLSPEKFPGQLIDALAVGSTADPWHQLFHDLTQILDIFSADFLNGYFDQVANFIFTKRLRQKLLKDLQLGFFLFGQLCPAPFPEEPHGFRSLLTESRYGSVDFLSGQLSAALDLLVVQC